VNEVVGYRCKGELDVEKSKQPWIVVLVVAIWNGLDVFYVVPQSLVLFDQGVQCFIFYKHFFPDTHGSEYL